MEGASVRSLCPDSECNKSRESSPRKLLQSDAGFVCPECRTARCPAEFTRTEHDLETLKRLG